MKIKWINVEDKLPELKQEVLVRSGNRFYVAWMTHFNKENKREWQYSHCCGCMCDDITHWALLTDIKNDKVKQ